MKYVCIVNIVGAVLGIVAPQVYYNYLSLDVYAILHGQIWRIVTFVLSPSDQIGSSPLINLVWAAIWIFVYYSIGSNLEQMWGTFRFNLFYFGGLLWVLVTTFVFYFILSNGWLGMTALLDYSTGTDVIGYLNQTMFLAFALTFPDAQILFYFVIPIKAKWFSVIYLLLDGYTLFVCFRAGQYYTAAVILVLLLHFFLFFFLSRGSATPKQAYREKKRKQEYRRKVEPRQTGPRHRCVICGRTEADAPHLEFRYCSKCEGNYEYCSEHLFTHEHVRHD
jgi:hypothetical protein